MINAYLTGLLAPLTLLASITFTAPKVNAITMDSGDNKHIYLRVEDGKQVDPVTAFQEALKDKAILDCSPVEAVGNQRTGKVTLRKKK